MIDQELVQLWQLLSILAGTFTVITKQFEAEVSTEANLDGVFPLLLRAGCTSEELDARFSELVENNPELVWEQTADGEIVMMLPAGANSSRRNSMLTTQIGNWANVHGGQAFDSSCFFKLPNGAKRGPDGAVIEQARWDSVAEEDRDSYSAIVPDFVVELRSNSDRLKTLQSKMEEYMSNGVRLGWLIDPVRRKVEIHRQGKPFEVRENPQSIEGEDILIGFVLDLNGIL